MMVRHTWRVTDYTGRRKISKCKVCGCTKDTYVATDGLSHSYVLPDGRKAVRLPKCDKASQIAKKPYDYTQSVRTRGSYDVKGLFAIGKLIYGYMRGKAGWVAQTWFRADGEHILGDKDKALRPKYEQA